MLESVATNDKLTFADLSEEEKQKRGILGRLYGPCADIIHNTRNGRKYSDELWEKVFQQPLVVEMLKNGGIPGEIDHPTDRSETDSTRIAIMLHEKPKKDKDGKLVAYFDILNTPCGQIAYQLAKYGFKWGVSSRGEGDIIEDYSSGEEKVDPDTYTLNAFDLVLIPSVEQARLDMISEGLGKKGSQLKKTLTESLNKANAGDRKIMEDTLKELNIDISDRTLNEDTNAQKSALNKEVEASSTVDNIKVDEIVKNLQESLKQVQTLNKKVKMLQEKLSVCNAKEAKLSASIQRSNETNRSLNEQLKDVSAKVSSLEGALSDANTKLEEKTKLAESLAKRNRTLRERYESELSSKKALMESKSSEVKSTALTEKLKRELSENKDKVNHLTESLEEAKQNLAIKEKELSTKVAKANRLAEGYKKLANGVVDRYIETVAKGLGIKSSDIRCRLGESYSLEDIDRVCEDLQSANIRMGDLPFEFKNTRKVTIKESKEPILPKSRFNDDIDDQLISFAGKYLEK